MNLAQLLASQATARPDQAALVEAGTGHHRILTYSKLDESAARAAQLFQEAGLRSGDAVLVLQPMSIDLYVALAALFRSGLVAMFLDPRTGRDHIERCCDLLPPRALIGCPTAHLLRFISPALRRIPVQFSTGLPLPGTIPFSRWRNLAPRRDIVPAQSDTPALVTFTSGSTSRPKAALRTHGFLLNQQRALETSLQLRPGERDLTALPTFGLANLASGLTTIISKAASRVGTSSRTVPILVHQLRTHHVDRISGAPAFLERLADFCLARNSVLPSLRTIYTGGGPVFPDLLERLAAVAPNARIRALYGCTEAEPIALLLREEIQEEDREAVASGAGLLAGEIEANLDLRIVPEAPGEYLGDLSPASFEARCAPSGVPGEIVVSGPHVLPGYLEAEADTNAKVRVGDTLWHRTGDAGYIDLAGRLWLLGRCCGRVQDRHGTVYPFQIEGVLRRALGPCRGALVSENGRRTLLLERQGATDPRSLRELLSHWQIDACQWVSSLPVDKRHHSKIDYAALLQHPCGNPPAIRQAFQSQAR